MTYKTSIGLNENIVGILCYLGFWMTGVLFLFIEKENKFVRFHAIQSAMVFMTLTAIVFLVAWIPYVGWLLADFGGFFSLFVWLSLMFIAWRGSKIKVPVIGKIAYNYVYK
ncbi:DUF4870 domain-containing protein [Methanococcoides sp. AM1]|uniref:DUF4870 domain-containing protein n=1 Tax=Methanococcoides sp. AM1 TaxID=1201011 RepID=UPI001083FE54|nr:hypothetical protein [Methanococcoides sp. AM1]